MNLEQTTTKIGETWGIASPLPREHIPKRSRPKDQRFLRIREEIKRVGVFSKTQELEFERARDSRGCRTGLDARESQLRTRSLLSIKCAKNEIENPLHKAQTRGLNQIKSPEGTRRIGPPFPIKFLTRFQQFVDKINSNERNRGRETQGRWPGETESPRTDYKSRP